MVAAATPTTGPTETTAEDETVGTDDEAAGNTDDTTTTTAAPGPTASTVDPNGGAVAPADEPVLGATTADGRPAVFYAITTDGRAVEVDTASGTVLRELAVADDPSEAGDPLGRYLDAVWPIPGGGGDVLVAECCEPAAGLLYRLPTGASIDGAAGSGLFAWAGVHDARGERLATSGFVSQVRATDESGADVTTIDLFESDGTISFVAWLTDRDGVVYAEPQDDRTVIRRFDFDAEGNLAAAAVFPVPYVARDLTVRADGNLVLLATENDGIDRGIVISPEGELQTAFDTAANAQVLDYDPRGLFVIELDANGRATWQGVGQSGELGEGYLWVQW